MNILDTTVQAPLDYTPSESVWEAVMAEGGDKKEENSTEDDSLVEKTANLKISSEENDDIITRVLKEKGIVVKENDHKKLKYYTVKVRGVFKCKCKRTWSSHKTTIKIDIFLKRLTKAYRQRCKRCKRWASPSFNLEEVMEKVISKYCKRSLNDGDVNGDSTLIDGNERRGNPRRPHEQSLCERCTELGRPCW